jgi:hypothetical protein
MPGQRFSAVTCYRARHSSPHFFLNNIPKNYSPNEHIVDCQYVKHGDWNEEWQKEMMTIRLAW